MTRSYKLILGALAGVAGISLAIIWSRPNASCPSVYLQSNDEWPAGMIMVDGQAELLTRIEALTLGMSELKEEMKELKNALLTMQDHVTNEQRGRNVALAEVAFRPSRTRPLQRSMRTRRKMAARTTSGARAVFHSSDEESDSGYMTAVTDLEQEEFSLDEGHSGEEERADNLSILLKGIDTLRQGTEFDKRESLNTLLAKREEFGQNSTFQWRLIRAYCDMHDISSSLEEKKTHGQSGKQVGEEAMMLDPLCAEMHQWYAIMCGMIAQYDTVQNKIKNGLIFKDHVDKAIALKPQDPFSYYLMGRWCYVVAQLSWIEKKVSAMLFGETPSATIQDALTHFLKVEDIHPRYSKANYVFLAKCYSDLGQTREARKMCEAACSMVAVSRDDEGAQTDLDLLCPSLGGEYTVQ